MARRRQETDGAVALVRRIRSRSLLAVVLLITVAVLATIADARWDLRGSSASEVSDAQDEESTLAGPELGPPPPPDDPDGAAGGLCEDRLARYVQPGNPFNAAVLAAYPSVAGDAAAEHEDRRGPGFRSSLRDEAPETFAAVCYFEADAFGIPYTPRPGESLPADVHTRLMEVVLPGGEALLLAAGREGDLQPQPLATEGQR